MTVAALLSLLMVGGATAQDRHPVADSAAAARAAWAEVGPKLQAGDLETAYAAAVRASAAWPMQPAYVWGRAVIAARRGDTVAVRSALQDYVGLGLGRDLRNAPAFAAYAGDSTIRGIGAQMDSARAPRVAGRELARLDDPDFWPEGIGADPRTGKVYVTSIRKRAVAEVTPGGGSRILLRQTPEMPLGAVLAARVDTLRNELWVTSSAMSQMEGFAQSDSSQSFLTVVDLPSGRVARQYAWIDGPHVLGEIIVTPAGDAWISDSRRPELYRIRAGSYEIETILHPLFRSLQGLALHPTKPLLYVADYSHGLLWLRLDTGEIGWMGAPKGSTTVGLDGITWFRDGIVAVQNGVGQPRIVAFTVDASGQAVVSGRTLDQQPLADEPTSIVAVGDRLLYVANSQWDKRGDDGVPRAGAKLEPPLVLEIPRIP